MAAPTQELPPWLSYSTFITRGATSSTLVELPLTYYGPSIPLGTNGVWTYGGLTSPASSPTSRTSTSPTATPTPSTTLRPTTTSGSASITETSGSTSSSTSSPTASSSLPASSSESVSSSTATPSSSIPISSASLSSSATPSLSSLSSASTASSASLSSTSISSASGTSTSSAAVGPTSSAPSTPPASGIRSSINKPALIGIVLGSIFGTVLLLLLLLLCLRWRRRRQNGNYQTPIWTGWEIVDPSAAELGNNGEERSPGEGSPRGSGEEADSFLRRSGGPQNMADIGRSVSIPAPAALAGVAAGVGAAAPHQGTNNSNGSGSSGGRTESTAVSDYGVLLADYTNARRSSEMGQGYFDDAEPRSRHIIPPSELLRLENERMEAEHIYRDSPGGVHDPDDPARYSPLAPPPPLVDPERNTPQSASSKSSFSIISAQEQEDPVVMSARRVHMSDVGPRGSERGSEESSPVASTSGGWGALGLGGIARLSRLSWFKNFRENLQDSPPTRPQSYVGVALSDSDVEAGRATLGRDLKRPHALGLDAAGERPISTVSTKSAMSGSTVYHDAHSVPGTPPPVPPMPRVYMSIDHPELHNARSGSTMSPPAYESEHMGSLAGQTQAAKDTGYAPRLVDVLDMPAPVSMSQFSSISSRGGMPFPPGLLTTPRSWYESSSSDAGESAGIRIDVLEDAPPQARDGWRVLARNGSIAYPEHRSSFGIPQLVHPHDMGAVSEMGSLHSMRSHLSPLSGRSSGSAPASSRHRLDGSNSSRPSAHSAQASSGRSLAHSGSISSDGQRRLRGNASPSLSAFGPQDDINSPDLSAQFPSPPPPPPPYLPRSPLAGLHDTAIRDTYSPGSSHTSHELTYGDHDGPFSPDSQLLAMPWATGLEHED